MPGIVKIDPNVFGADTTPIPTPSIESTTRKAVRRVMNLFLVIDVSGSMYGERIGAVNVALEKVMPELANIADKNSAAEIKVAVLTFATSARWLTPNPVSAAAYHYHYIKSEEVGGVTNLSTALIELDKKLSRHGKEGMMNEIAGSYAPLILFLSDGLPTDDYEDALLRVQDNTWYQHAFKVAVAVIDDSITSPEGLEMLAKLTGNVETVVKATNVEQLKKMIQFITITTSQFVTHGDSLQNQDNQPDPRDIINPENDINPTPPIKLKDINWDEFPSFG